YRHAPSAHRLDEILAVADYRRVAVARRIDLSHDAGAVRGEDGDEAWIDLVEPGDQLLALLLAERRIRQRQRQRLDGVLVIDHIFANVLGKSGDRFVQ